MPNSTIANLPSGSPAQSTDVLPIQRGSSTLKLAVSDIVTGATPQAPHCFLLSQWGGFTGADIDGSANPNLPLNGQVQCTLMFLPVPITIMSIAWGSLAYVSPNARWAYFGVYNNDSTKSLIIELGALTVPLSGTQPAASVFPLTATLPAGSYWFAWSSSDTTGNTITSAIIDDSLEQDLKNDYTGTGGTSGLHNTPSRGNAANSVDITTPSTAHMPASLGVVSKADIRIPVITINCNG